MYMVCRKKKLKPNTYKKFCKKENMHDSLSACPYE